MELQIRKSDYHGFVVVLVNKAGIVVRCHNTPDEMMLEEFSSAFLPLEKRYWLNERYQDDRPEVYGELVATRKGRNVIEHNPKLLKQLLHEVATYDLADRKAYLKATQEDLNARERLRDSN